MEMNRMVSRALLCQNAFYNYISTGKAVVLLCFIIWHGFPVAKLHALIGQLAVWNPPVLDRGHRDGPKFTIIAEEVLLCFRQEKILKIEAEEHCNDGT